MKRIALALVLAATASFAEPIYQVTGRLTGMPNDSIIIQRGNETWAFKRDPSVPANIMLGSKVTIHYTPVAKSMIIAPEKVAPSAAAPGPVKHATSVKAH